MKLFLFLSLLLNFEILNASSLRIEAIDLSKTLQTYKVLDTRSQDLYIKGHIQNALNFPINQSYENKELNGKIVQPVKVQKILRELGLDINDNIIIYDDGTFFDASRLFWTLEVYGFKNIKLLNTGYEQWKRYGFQINTALPSIAKSSYIASVNNKRLATKFSTQIATKSPKYVILDARGIKAYNGEVSMAKRFGHIPKALYYPAAHNIDTDGLSKKLKTHNGLKEVYANIKKDTKVIVYCAIGRIASTNYFALRELGYDVANYDSSWREWGNDFSLPIINLSEK